MITAQSPTDLAVDLLAAFLDFPSGFFFSTLVRLALDGVDLALLFDGVAAFFFGAMATTYTCFTSHEVRLLNLRRSSEIYWVQREGWTVFHVNLTGTCGNKIWMSEYLVVGTLVSEVSGCGLLPVANLQANCTCCFQDAGVPAMHEVITGS